MSDLVTLTIDGVPISVPKGTPIIEAAKQAGGSAVMAGVFEALVATAVGLLVALPAVFAFNFFQRRVRQRLLQTDAMAHLVLSFLKADRPAHIEQLATPEMQDAQ